MNIFRHALTLYFIVVISYLTSSDFECMRTDQERLTLYRTSLYSATVARVRLQSKHLSGIHDNFMVISSL